MRVRTGRFERLRLDEPGHSKLVSPSNGEGGVKELAAVAPPATGICCHLRDLPICGRLPLARVFTDNFDRIASSPRLVTLPQLRLTTLAVTSLRWDFHPQECAHAARTTKKPGISRAFSSIFDQPLTAMRFSSRPPFMRSASRKASSSAWSALRRGSQCVW